MANDDVLLKIELKLGQMLRLIALQSTRELKQTQAIELLSAAGFEPKLIADMLKTTSNTVSVSLSKSKAKKKPVRTNPNANKMNKGA
jgi:hypothetical protein